MIIHLDAPDQGDIPFRRFTFPDGQPHIEFDAEQLRQAAKHGPIEMIGAVKSGMDLLNIALAIEAVRSVFPDGPVPLSLNISYLLGARMDRRIAPGQPATLNVIASLLNAATVGLAHVRVLDPHSPVLLAQLHGVDAMHPDALVAYALARIEREDGRPAVVVVPDSGAVPRTLGILSRLNASNGVARCSKKRDSQTGKLSGFHLDEGDVAGRTVMIVDDICDGGGTFSGVANVLREHGASKVHLCVTHGIFSKGIVIAGIDTVFCTDSYRVPEQAEFEVEPDVTNRFALVFKRRDGIKLVILRRYVERVLGIGNIAAA